MKLKVVNQKEMLYEALHDFYKEWTRFGTPLP